MDKKAMSMSFWNYMFAKSCHTGNSKPVEKISIGISGIPCPVNPEPHM
jgi:hypothetical protein